MTKSDLGDEEFDRAMARMAHVRWGTAAISARVRERFGASTPLHRLTIFAEGPRRFHLLVFFENDADVRACTGDGTAQRIRSFVKAELEATGRDEGQGVEIRLELDSHENVQRTCGGNYFLRLRMGP